MGLRIGLFGGTFNPPHEGHRLASMIALSRLGLDRIWWIVTPGNPLKNNNGLPPLADHPRIDVTGFEAEIGARYTFDTIRWLKRRCPGVEFVWIMGADNLASFHRWQRWREIANMVAIAVIDRPASTLKATHSRGGQYLSRYRLREHEARLLFSRPAPAFVFLHGPRSDLSSTLLRGKAQASLNISASSG
jgi:nicotinate-nucleotide adenylyltransferase